MTRNLVQPTNVAAANSLARPVRNIWQQRSATGEAIWSSIAWAFAVYWVFFVLGAFLHRKELNAMGGVIVLGVLAWLTLERLWTRMDGVVMASVIAAVFLPVAQIIAGSPPEPEALFKHVSLCLVIAISRLLDLPAAWKSKMRWPLAAQILAILLISLTIFKGTSWDDGTRHSGLFVNPNNLALIPFLLLFFIDPVKDGWRVRIITHTIVVAVLAFSGTNGAILAYAIGLAVHFRRMISARLRAVVGGLTIAAALLGAGFLAIEGERLLPQTRLTRQISVMRDQVKNVIHGSNIAYYEQERVLGPGSASAIWRVAHWRRALITYLDGTPAQQIFGLGIGSSPRILGKLPHNEYLRMLFEQGIAGLLLFIFAWQRIIRTAPREVRYIGLIVAIYSFSENNLDNFPFMALFILCLSARGLSDAVAAKIKHPILALWSAGAQRV